MLYRDIIAMGDKKSQAPWLEMTFNACLTYAKNIWGKLRVVLTEGEKNCTIPKDMRPISLTSFQ